MKFAFLNEEGIIRNYVIEGNEIVINYLDDTIVKINYTEENEQKLQEKMLEQAEQRNKEVKPEFYARKRREEMSNIRTFSIYTLLNTSTFLRADLEWIKIAAGVMVGITGGLLTYSSIKCKQLNDKKKELEKYRIYLTMIKGYENSNAQMQLKSNGKEVNINTLDDFSLRDIKKLNKNLIRQHIQKLN